jgi:LysM repeat protein
MSSRLIFGYCVLGVLGIVLLVITILAIRVITLDTDTEAPTRRTSARTYEVKEGDNLAAISRETGVPVPEIEDLNPTLDPQTLLPGQRIKLRKATPAERRRAAQRRANLPRTYRVKQGDGVLLIAEKTKVSVPRLYALNPDRKLKNLRPGMRLRLRR